MDFLLECLGFPPDEDLDALAERIRAEGETVPYRGPEGEHLRAALAGGVELRLDQEEGEDFVQLFPYHTVRQRLRVAIQSLKSLPDSPFDALLIGVANPPLPTDEPLDLLEREDYVLATYLTDARRLPDQLPRGHVLAISVAGFALDVEHIGPERGPTFERIADDPTGSSIVPLGGSEAPSGTVELSLVVSAVRSVQNPWSGHEFWILEVGAPGRPLELFCSRWQLSADGIPDPRVGWHIEGVFLFTGRISGGLPRPRRRT